MKLNGMEPSPNENILGEMEKGRLTKQQVKQTLYEKGSSIAMVAKRFNSGEEEELKKYLMHFVIENFEDISFGNFINNRLPLDFIYNLVNALKKRENYCALYVDYGKSCEALKKHKNEGMDTSAIKETKIDS